MALQYSTTLRNNQLDQFETTLGASAKLRLYSGAPPANTSSPATGTLLVEMNLPADYMVSASGGIKVLSGVWSGISVGTGIAGYFRFVTSDGSVTHAQGIVASSGGDMTINNTSISVGQTIIVSTFTLIAGDA